MSGVKLRFACENVQCENVQPGCCGPAIVKGSDGCCGPATVQGRDEVFVHHHHVAMEWS